MLQLKIVSPEKVVFQGEVESVLVPGTLGSFEILNDHAPINSSLGGIHHQGRKTDNEHQRRIRRMQEKRSKPLCGSII